MGVAVGVATKGKVRVGVAFGLGVWPSARGGASCSGREDQLFTPGVLILSWRVPEPFGGAEGILLGSPPRMASCPPSVLPKSHEDELVPVLSNSHIMDHTPDRTPTESLTPEPKKLQKSLITILIWTSLVLILALAFM